MSKTNWTYKEWTSAIADTGDYDAGVEFTNGKDTLYSNGEDLETEDLQKFCEYLDMMPDLWSRKTDGLEFENSQLTKQVEHLKSALEKIATGTQPYNEMEQIIKALQLAKDSTYAGEMIEPAKEHLRKQLDEAMNQVKNLSFVL